MICGNESALTPSEKGKLIMREFMLGSFSGFSSVDINSI